MDNKKNGIKYKGNKMTIKIKNPWTKAESPNKFYTNLEFIHSYKTGKIYKTIGGSYLYCDNDIAFNELVGLDKSHLKNVINRIGKNDSFIYNRAIETLERQGIK